MRASRHLLSKSTSVNFVFVLLFCAATAIVSPAQTLTTLHSFNGSDGINPYREGLVQGADGNFYGTTDSGGSLNFGVVFKMTPDGTVTLVHDFAGSDGEHPESGLVQDAAGNFYGTTRGGGPGPDPGVVYKITPQGTFSIVTGGGGGVIYAPVLVASDGDLYGVAYGGGDNGSAFKVGTDGSNLRILYTFCSLSNCVDGAHPLAGLIEGLDHNFYGTTTRGGANNDGVVFKLTPTGAYTVLHSFGGASDGFSPRGKLLLASDSFLYGTTNSGGPPGVGTIFKIKPDGSNFTVLFAYCQNHDCSAGSTPESGLIEGPDGNFYGTAGGSGQFGRGTVYRLTPSGQATSLHAFCNCGDGSNPYTDLLLANDGNFYGTTYIGGSDNEGTVFSLTGPGLIPTTTTLTTNPNPSQLNQTVTMTATVHAQSGTPVGNVVFSSDGMGIGTVALSNGVAVLNYSSLPLGTHAIVAVYQGGNGFAGSTSNTVQQVVQRAASMTTVTSMPNPSIFGQQVTITATVSPAGPPAPTGTVGFTSNGSTITGCSAVPLSSNTAICTTSALTIGTDAIVATYSGDGNYAGSSSGLSQIVNPIPTPLQFIAAPPCRVVDTRNPDGQFGGPAIQGNTSRSFPIPQGSCNIPSSAAAYSLNVTVVPHHPLNYLTIWPTGQQQPFVSTMNSSDGRFKANAAIVPAGDGGAVSVYVTDTSDVILDINGYFVPPAQNTAQFYPLTPCRVVDTRDANQPMGLGPPSLMDMETRDLPILTSACLHEVTNPQAYSFNVTVVPVQGQPLNYLTVWPSDQSQPFVSTLNNPTATVVANGAIVPAAAGSGNIKVFAFNATDVIMDINGYFAAPGGGYSLYSVAPCRVIDTRDNNGQPFQNELTVNVVGGPCAPPNSAAAYVLNATVVPSGFLDYLTLWPEGQMQPNASTLNAYDGLVTSNIAIIPTSNGSIDAYAAELTHLILDISSYFAP